MADGVALTGQAWVVQATGSRRAWLTAATVAAGGLASLLVWPPGGTQGRAAGKAPCERWGRVAPRWPAGGPAAAIGLQWGAVCSEALPQHSRQAVAGEFCTAMGVATSDGGHAWPHVVYTFLRDPLYGA